MKTLTFIRQSRPEQGGFNDQAINADGLKVCARTWPNPFQPSTGKTCQQAYGAMVPGIYPAVFMANHPRFGRCFEIAGGGEIPCEWDNVNHGGRPVMSEVFNHHGETDEWSGSAGCLTVKASQSLAWFAGYADGESVTIDLQEVAA
jgi:hypothetical protein